MLVIEVKKRRILDVMKNYAGFIKDNHLKIDTKISLFKE